MDLEYRDREGVARVCVRCCMRSRRDRGHLGNGVECPKLCQHNPIMPIVLCRRWTY